MVKTFNSSPIQKINRKSLRNLASRVWQAFHREPCEISLNFVSIDEIVELNRNYLQKDHPTDVLSFNLGKSPNATLIADVYICPEVARQNAEYYACDLKIELARLVIHGMLHVIGYHDATEQEKNEMRRLEDEFLQTYW
jgi:probable rRNA maturation factor